LALISSWLETRTLMMAALTLPNLRRPSGQPAVSSRHEDLGPRWDP
jgi:hypothetical protein